jgi:predicted metalloprotease with PDZ domain
MRRLLFYLFLFSLPFTPVAQQVRYDVSAPNAAHHEAEVVMTVNGLPAGPALFRMSRSSPGRYATHEFGKNVYNVKAVDKNGKTLPVEKLEADVYRVSHHNGTVKLQYTLYGNHADGTYAEIDPTHLHLNMPASFMWVKGLEKAPVTVRFSLPDTAWTIATQLKPTADKTTFTAPGLQYFMDSPVKAADLKMPEWTVKNPDGKSYTIRLALQATGSDSATAAFTKHVQRIVQEARAVFGELPAFDYGTYTFLASITPYVKGDGMEHRNSTMIALPMAFDRSTDALEVFAHEFFHAWNVERIRPKSLEPFNFEKSNVSEALWIAEGFTQYYGQLLMKRAGFTSDDDFRRQMAGLINTKENTPGAMYYTPIDNSKLAVVVDAGVSIDRTNYGNMHTSYYTYGGALALALDLQLRQQFGKTMDDFMRELWKRFGRPEKPYTLPGVQAALGAVSSPGFAADFFRKHVYAQAPIDYASHVKAAGWNLGKAAAGKAWIGNTRFTTANESLVVAGNTTRNTPLYDAGVDYGDILVSLAGTPVKSNADLEKILTKQKPGDVVELVFSHRGEKKTVKMTLAENPAFALTLVDAPTEKQKAFLAAWAETQVK